MSDLSRKRERERLSRSARALLVTVFAVEFVTKMPLPSNASRVGPLRPEIVYPPPVHAPPACSRMRV